MQLYHKKSGTSLEITLRPFQPEDAHQIISCIRDAYGDSYVKPVLYTPEGILHHDKTGEMRFCVAAAGDTIVGITGCGVSGAFPGMAEIACQIIRREYNGYGLALPLALYTMEQAEKLPLTGQFARALGCHLISQKTLAGMGFTPCGFLLNIFDKEVFRHHFDNGNYAKIPQALAVKRQGKTAAGAIWLPEELVPLAAEMYQTLGLSWCLQDQETVSPPASRLEREQLSDHKTLTLWSRTCGRDLPDLLAAELAAVAEHPGQTVNLYLNLSCPGSRTAYQEARRQGFFFTGFFPCCADGEYLVMHHALKVPVLLDGIPHIPEYAPFLNEIRRQLCSK